jgi:hypothetical protein
LFEYVEHDPIRVASDRVDHHWSFRRVGRGSHLEEASPSRPRHHPEKTLQATIGHHRIAARSGAVNSFSFFQSRNGRTIVDSEF